ncbi:TEF9 [Auxenochlorella protothecoides x Auxenochlorella symbiontica]
MLKSTMQSTRPACGVWAVGPSPMRMWRQPARAPAAAPRMKPVRAHKSMDEAALSLLAATGFMLALPEAAHADILTGRIASLAHPVAMIALFGSSVYTAVLGFQYRRTRDLAAEIKDLKAQAPTAPKGEGEEASSAVASPEQSRIKELEQERKDLIRKKLNEKHYTWGSVLLGLGITFSIIGPVNTYLRTGKLFPGPHLYFGALITVLWALAASLSPAMQKGNETARITHITLNCLALFFFASQIPTGWEIVVKVLENTSFP